MKDFIGLCTGYSSRAICFVCAVFCTVQILPDCCVAGYELVSTLPTVVYRTESFPGLGFLLKKSFFDSSMKQHMDECCMNRFVDVVHCVM